MYPKIGQSAFIYTKTYKVDYRILVVPDDFTEDKKKWVTSYVKEVSTAITLQSLSPPEDLVQRVFLSDGQHYVFGVLCNFKKLLTEDERKDWAEKYLSQADEKAKDLTVDNKSRRIAFAFLGYVIQRTSDIPELSPIRFELDIFKPLCEHLCKKWLEETQNPPTPLPYKADESPEWLFAPSPKCDSLPSLNTNPRKLALHPATEAYIQQLWTAAAICEKPHTLWIGQLPGNPNPASILVSSVPERSILESSFLNIALPNIDSLKIYYKQPEATVEATHIPTTDSNFLDIISDFLAFLAGEIQKVPGVFSHKLIEEIPRVQREVSAMQRKKDEEIAYLQSKISELNSKVDQLEDRIKKLEQRR